MRVASSKTLLAAVSALFLSACGGSADDAAGTSGPLAAVGCAGSALPSGAGRATFAVPGWPDRDYDIALPASYRCGQPIAVALAFHGGGGNKANMRQTACPGGDVDSAGCIDRVALAAGMAVVFPNGTKVRGSELLTPDGIRTWNAGGGNDGWNCVSGNACNNGVDDVAYVRALVADIAARIALDPKRTFASGFSNGAALAHRLACQAADLFAAVAPVSGQNQYAVDGCTPSRRSAVLDIHGSADGCWPYGGGVGDCVDAGRVVSVAQTLSGWAGRNGCARAAEVATLAPLPDVRDDGTSVVRHAWTGCGGGGEVVHLQVVGGGHYWSRGHSSSVTGNSGGVLSQQLDTSRAVIEFFAAHGRP